MVTLEIITTTEASNRSLVPCDEGAIICPLNDLYRCDPNSLDLYKINFENIPQDAVAFVPGKRFCIELSYDPLSKERKLSGKGYVAGNFYKINPMTNPGSGGFEG